MLSYYTDNLDPWVSSGFELFDAKLHDANDIDHIKLIMMKYLWSPIIWRNGVRKKTEFECAYFLALDFENPQISLGKVIQFCRANQYWHIIGTTKNHRKKKGEQPAMDRFRVLLLFERPIRDVREYEFNLAVVTKKWGADQQCVDGARLFFPCSNIEAYDCSLHLNQYPVTALPKSQPSSNELKKNWEIIAKKRQRSKLLTRFTTQWLLNVIPLHERNNTCFRLGCEFYRMGFSFEDAMQKILASPTYVNKEISPALLLEIHRAVHSGFKAAIKSDESG